MKNTERLRIFFAIGCAVLCVPSLGITESLVAARAIPARTVISVGDVAISKKLIPGALREPLDAVGMEARVTIYSGRPIRLGDLGPPALVERNDIVRLRFAAGTLVIETEGRALARGAKGDRISVMNLASRSTVSGAVIAHGEVEVSR